MIYRKEQWTSKNHLRLKMKGDMSAEAVTQRLEMLDQLWELAVELQSATVTDEKAEPDLKDDGKSPD